MSDPFVNKLRRDNGTAEMKLLIVDDSARFRALVRSSLAALGAQIEECSDGEGAVEMYTRSLPDLTLMDIRMAGMNGLAATQTIRGQYQNAKIIILTAFDDDDLREAAREAGASGYALKDDLQALMRMIRSFEPEERS